MLLVYVGIIKHQNLEKKHIMAPVTTCGEQSTELD
jgi:hypothetical protein